MDRQQTFERFGMRITKIPAWQAVLAAAVILSLGLALAVLVTGLFLIVFPVLLIAGAAYRFFGPRSARRAQGAASAPPIIDGEYTVIDRTDRDRP